VHGPRRLPRAARNRAGDTEEGGVRHGPEHWAVSLSQGLASSARRPFIITPYWAAEDGTLVATIPERCPFAADDPQPCTVRRHHARARKTGPRFAVVVARCTAHDRAFTLYPPGHRPYGRKSVAPATLQGELLLAPLPAAPADGVAPREEARAPRRPAWGWTVFDAALDAAKGAAWPREIRAEGQAADDYWNTQRRWLVTAARLIGIHVDTPDRDRERIAAALDIPHLTLRDAAHDFASAGGYRSRGAVVVSVLDRLALRRSLADDLSYCGAVAGLWGRPSRWDPGGRTLRCLGVPVLGSGAR
jgi:hypothetical protein